MKKGEVVISLVMMVVLITTVVAGSYKIITENRYVGDKATLKVYDLYSCDIKFIPKENRINFQNLEEAEKDEYVLTEC